MPWMPGIPQDYAEPKGYLDPIAITLHRTYGGWGGDYSVIKNQSLCQFLIGKEPGQWVEFMDSNSVAFHCNGANFRAVGIELTGTNDDPLTDWQEARLGDVLRFLSQAHGIPLNYLDPNSVGQASVWVNGGGFSGVISHFSVQTDDGSSQHSDLVTPADFARALDAVPPAPPKPPPIFPEEDDMLPMFAQNGVDVWRMGDTRRPIRPPEWSALVYRYAAEHNGAVLKVLPFDQQWWDDTPDVVTLKGGGSGGSSHFTGTVDLHAA